MASRREVERYLTDNTANPGSDLVSDPASCTSLARAALAFAVKNLSPYAIAHTALPEADLSMWTGSDSEHDEDQADHGTILYGSIPMHLKQFADIKQYRVTEVLLTLSSGALSKIHGVLIRAQGHRLWYNILGSYGCQMDTWIQAQLTQSTSGQDTEIPLRVYKHDIRYIARVICFDDDLKLNEPKRYDLVVGGKADTFNMRPVIHKRTWLGELPQTKAGSRPSVIFQNHNGFYGLDLSQDTPDRVKSAGIYTSGQINAVPISLNEIMLTKVCADAREKFCPDYILSSRRGMVNTRYGRPPQNLARPITAAAAEYHSEESNHTDSGVTEHSTRKRKRRPAPLSEQATLGPGDGASAADAAEQFTGCLDD